MKHRCYIHTYIHHAYTLLLLMLAGYMLASCKAEDKIPVHEQALEMARKDLNGEIVLRAKAFMGDRDLTLLPVGCPVKYKFSWHKPDVMTVEIVEFSVGNMPLTIWFACNCEALSPNSIERKELPNPDQWIKFFGDYGYTEQDKPIPSPTYTWGNKGKGAVTIFYNPYTKMISFNTVFNVMDVSTEVYQQKVDPTKLATYDEDFLQYEIDLFHEKYKRLGEKAPDNLLEEIKKLHEEKKKAYKKEDSGKPQNK